uniref:Uncharacterized protein n=1 Tax=Avena sativa TaxID=4498 RepID=A0ACD5XBQ7_AVESA
MLDYFPTLVGLNLGGYEKVVKKFMTTLSRLHNPIIEERISRRSTLRGQGEKRDFLDILVSLEYSEGRPLLSFEEIQAQTAEIMYATIDNPSNSVEWALAEMMNKPEVMQKAIEELDRVVGKERLVEESDIPKLNYLKSCIREAFRIHPYHAFNLSHVAMEDTVIAGYKIPKDSQIILTRVGLGRNPKVWNEPLEFQPERHLNNHDSNTNVSISEPELRFLPFSTGRRGCPGISLGTSVTMMLFARMLQGFTWTKPSGTDKINLEESYTGLALAKRLVLQAKPRLAVHLYGIN